MPKPKIYTEEQRRERKKQYDMKYQANRYKNDPSYREYRIEHMKKYNTKKKIEEQSNILNDFD